MIGKSVPAILSVMLGVSVSIAQGQSGMSAQMGVKITPDTVTIGQPFLLVVRVRVKPGFTAEFPQMPDSSGEKPSTIALIGAPLLERPPTDSLEFRATYKLTAWDVGAQAIPLTDVHVVGPQGTGFLPLRATVFVKSVLPADTTLRVPKPLRARYPVQKTNWWPLIILAIAAALAELLWWIYKRWRARRDAPRDPYDVALDEFKRVEALELPQKGEPERHAVLMAEAMRVYLSAKVPAAGISDTPRQLVDHVTGAGLADERVRGIMEETELLKFARARTSSDASLQLGRNARAIVELVEKQLEPKPDDQAKAA
ncbi:MAG: hypothetical protein H0W69_11145 [Gemmatimonadaceae bacterium]|nr:hypothetical protein [Gemmatimonadaceae bacterium]